MAKYAIPAEVVFTFDDEPVDIQEMIHDNAESEEVVDGLERLLKAVAAPGFTEAEVVFDIGGGISVVRAARRTANPRKAVGTDHFNASTLKALKRRGIRIIGITAIPANDHDRYFSATGYELDDNGTHRIRTYLEVLAIADGAPVDREDNPGDDGQQSLPLDYGRTGNPRGGGLVSGYGINTFAMDPDDYAPERQSNPRESIATMLGRTSNPRVWEIDDRVLEQYAPGTLRHILRRLDDEQMRLRHSDLGLTQQQQEDRFAAIIQKIKVVENALRTAESR